MVTLMYAALHISGKCLEGLRGPRRGRRCRR